MIIHDELIHQYIHDKELDTSVFAIYPVQAIDHIVNPKRKNIVLELHYQFSNIIKNYSFFNLDLIKKLDNYYISFLDTVHLHFVVGAPVPYDMYSYKDQHSHLHLYVDLLQIADATPIVSQMLFVLQNQMSEQCLLFYLNKKFPLSSNKYLDALHQHAFVYGLATLLSWANTIDTYTFQLPAYDKRKEQTFGMLFEAIQITEEKAQLQLLAYLKKAPLWNQFTRVAGMFYLYDIYLEQGQAGLEAVYQKGTSNFIHQIFQ